jgi:hypothetical protein
MVRPGGLDRGDTTLLRTVIGGAVVALIAAVLAIVGPGIGLNTLWPLLLAAGIALAAGPAVASRVGALTLGAVVGLVAMALQAGVLPATGLADAIVVIIGVGILTLVAALTQGLLPLWAGLAGYGLFVGYYTPTYTESPTTFLADAPIAFVTVLLAIGLGAIVALAAEFAGVTVGGRESHEPHARAGEVA